jgi:hypothetical protein
MKQLLLVSQFFIMSITTYAQSLGPQTFNTSGGKGNAGTFHLDWSIGEPAVTTFNSSNVLLSQGLLQPDPSYAFPVTLIYFTGKAADQRNELGWATSEETNNDYFEVERSSNGVIFSMLERVSGAGNHAGTKTYSMVDEAPYPHTYYRLKQVDYDGTTSYSSIIYVKQATAQRFSLYPNPTRGLLNLAAKEGGTPVHIVIYDFNGREMLQKTHMPAGVMTIDVQHLIPGKYIIKVEHASEEIWSAPFLKL